MTAQQARDVCMSMTIATRYGLSTLAALVSSVSTASGQELIWRVDSTAKGQLFGARLSRVEDLNGDRVIDVVVGAPGTNCASFFDGRVFVRDGDAGSPLFDWCGDEDLAGYSVSWVHDVDGGGRPDVLVGARLYDEPTLGDGTGRVVLLSGETGQPIWQLIGEYPDSRFGSVVIGLDDLDGDGFDEILVTAPNWDFNGLGRVYVVSSIDAHVIRIHQGTKVSDNLGSAATRIADVDGDGLCDYALYTTLDRDQDGGRIDVYSGASGAFIISWTGDSNQELGAQMQDAGDWNGDGSGDLMSWLHLGGVGDAGIRVYSPATGNLLYELFHDGTNFGDGWGYGLGMVGDMNHDGYAEYAIGVPYDRHDGRAAGRVDLYSGRTKRILYHYYPGYADGAFGDELIGGDDLNGDGIPDLVIGATGDRKTAPLGGSAQAWSGNDLFLQAEPLAPAVGATVIVDLRGGEPNLLGLIALTDISGTPMFEPLLLAPFDVNGELQLCADIDAAASGLDFTILAYAQNRNIRGPLSDSLAVTVSVQ